MPSTKVHSGLYWSDRTKTWHYEFKFRSKKYNGDTKMASSKELATRWLAQFKERLAGAEVGLEMPVDIPTLKQAWADWKLERGPRVGERWRDIVRTQMELHLVDLLDLRLSQITTKVVDGAVAAYLGKENHSAGGANVMLRALNGVVGHKVKQGVIKVKPYSVSQVPVQAKPRIALTPAKLKLLMDQLVLLGASGQALDLIRLMAGLGLRSSEARFARVESLDLGRRLFTPWDPVEGTKGKEAEACPVPKWLVKHLKRMAGDRQEGYLVQASRAKVVARRLAYTWIVAAREALGWPWLTPHELRSSYATMLSEEGVSPQTIQKILRHKQLKTTERYLRVNRDAASKALDRIGRAAKL